MKDYLAELIDMTSDGYLNPTPAVYDNGTHNRSESIITSIAVHHDASNRPHDYDSVARYKSEAAEHYNRLGPGLQYHYKIDNVGQIFRIRPHTVWLYALGSQENVTSINICLDGYFHPPQNQQPTREQYEALKQLLDWLCTHNPQFPADQADVHPHRYFQATACCGDMLVPFVEEYRTSNGNPAIPNVPYDWPSYQPVPPTPVPIPPPPDPTPPSPPDPTPVPQPTPPPTPPVPSHDWGEENNSLLKQILGLVQWLVDKLKAIFK